ncbi:MAG: DNA-protecting protein DprA [Oscillospiraceae bacterium]|nr:DNA-protecting protein DprA [Oscillospiraceae bacterium]
MKVAIIGSRNLVVNNIGEYLPDGTTEIVSGGARGIDTCARNYALANNISLVEFLPNYNLLGSFAPLARNRQIVDAADIVVAFWDNVSRGTRHTIDYAADQGKQVILYCLINR